MIYTGDREVTVDEVQQWRALVEWGYLAGTVLSAENHSWSELFPKVTKAVAVLGISHMSSTKPIALGARAMVHSNLCLLDQCDHLPENQ